jgi:hypothetical protein
MALSFKGTIPSLTTDNYACWVVSMQALLDLEGLWDEVAPVNPACSTVGPLHAPLPSDARNNRKALSLIVLHVAHNLNHIVAFCTSAREAWQKLSDHFQGFGLVWEWELQHKLATLKCGLDVGSVSEMCAQVNSIVSELAMIGEPVPDILTRTENKEQLQHCCTTRLQPAANKDHGRWTKRLQPTMDDDHGRWTNRLQPTKNKGHGCWATKLQPTANEDNGLAQVAGHVCNNRLCTRFRGTPLQCGWR